MHTDLVEIAVMTDCVQSSFKPLHGDVSLPTDAVRKGLPRSFFAVKFLNSLIVKLGLVISESKLYAPQTCIPCLGIDVNVVTGNQKQSLQV